MTNGYSPAVRVIRRGKGFPEARWVGRGRRGGEGWAGLGGESNALCPAHKDGVSDTVTEQIRTAA